MAEDEQDTPAGLKQQLEEYRASLEELNEGLTIDPANEELVKLKKDLLEVIVITETRLRILSQNATDPTPPAAAGAASPRPVETINVGDKVYSIYSADGLWYEAVVKQVQPGGTYSVTFTGYGNSEDRKQEHLRRIDGSVTLEQLNAVASAAQGNSKKRTTAAWESSTTDPKKQAKQAAKPKKEDPTVQAWKQFANKAPKMKTGTGIPKRKESIFKSPDDPTGKVGVTGSGKPMTKYTETRQKWDKLKDPTAAPGASED